MAAESRQPCAAARSPRPAVKKGPGLGGLFGVVKRAGVGNVLGSGILGDGEAARAARAARTELARRAENICKARESGQPATRRGPATNGKP